MTYNKFVRYVLIFEAIALNAGTGALCLFAPRLFVSQFSADAMPAAGYEFIRWYGVLLWVLAFYVLRILPANDNRLLAPAVEALLFGDIIHLFAIYMFYRAAPIWSFPFFIMLGFTVSLAVIRSIWVYKYNNQ
ncbi:MAG: hypothetical protein PHQ36_00285 [Anaerolineales bacterium]|nr:hypothetical protein [Anaerolineales bacterium]